MTNLNNRFFYENKKWLYYLTTAYNYLVHHNMTITFKKLKN